MRCFEKFEDNFKDCVLEFVIITTIGCWAILALNSQKNDDSSLDICVQILVHTQILSILNVSAVKKGFILKKMMFYSARNVCRV